LSGVSSVGVVAGDPPAHRMDAVVVTSEQLVECPTVSPLGCSHQLVVGELCCDGGETTAAAALSGGDEVHLRDIAAVRIPGALVRLRELLEQHQHIAGRFADRHSDRLRVGANCPLQW
jgi:hypothetical protein